MKKTALLSIALCLMSVAASAQIFSGEYTTELEWNGGDRVNWANLLRLNLNVPLWTGAELQASTLHIADVNDAVLDDWQVFSNIYEESKVAAIAVCGLWQELSCADLFFGVRSMNEDFFVSDCTSLFTNSSEGIFPTIAACMPIANYPVSSMNFYFDLHFGGWTFKNSTYNGVGYNGWKKGDNPFVVKFGRDGLLNVSELSYAWDKGSYYAGVAVHSRTFTADPENEMELCESVDAIHKGNAAWYIHGEQTLYTTKNDNRLMLMAQYSENAYHNAACRRYAQLGSVYAYGDDQIGVAARYCGYLLGDEWSVEGTWYKQLNSHFAVQPAVSYIKNAVYGDMVGIIARLYVNF
ncbi:MAG: porin [Bacteroidales bacterium]|nr:porin [Bacteroidales bacterium]